jgi:hypothetical protein
LKNVSVWELLVSDDIYRKKSMQISQLLDNYLGKKTRFTEKAAGNGYTEVCDLDTGDCYTVRDRDGLIERVDNTMRTNRKVQVETPQGVKQLLNG